MNSYTVKEIFYSIQGEGAHAGRPAVFCRFSGCNLWNGYESGRAHATCRFCDTDFVGTDGIGGGQFDTAEDLSKQIASYWPTSQASHHKPFVVCTGGEPLLQLDTPLITALHEHDFEIAIETNGTLLPPPKIDWTCVSPKADAELLLKEGDELKLVYPQDGVDPQTYLGLKFRYFFLQPMDSEEASANTAATVRYCLDNPEWRLSLQTHKFLGLR